MPIPDIQWESNDGYYWRLLYTSIRGWELYRLSRLRENRYNWEIICEIPDKAAEKLAELVQSRRIA